MTSVKTKRAALDTAVNIKMPKDLSEALTDVANSMGLRFTDICRHAAYDYLNRYTDIKLESAPKHIVTPTHLA